MAVGDIVNGISADNTIIDFQPAAGVEVVITSFVTALGNQATFFNGTNTANAWVAAIDSGFFANVKMFIDNTIFLRVVAQGNAKFGGFSGITVT